MNTHRNTRKPFGRMMLPLAIILVTALLFAACGKPEALPAVDAASLVQNAEQHYALRFDSNGKTESEIAAHYEEVFSALGLQFGGQMSAPNGQFWKLALGVPAESFSDKLCYQYAAVLLALDPALAGMELGSIGWLSASDGCADEFISVSRADVEAYFGDTVSIPFSEAAQSEEVFGAFIADIAGV